MVITFALITSNYYKLSDLDADFSLRLRNQRFVWHKRKWMQNAVEQQIRKSFAKTSFYGFYKSQRSDSAANFIVRCKFSLLLRRFSAKSINFLVFECSCTKPKQTFLVRDFRHISILNGHAFSNDRRHSSLSEHIKGFKFCFLFGTVWEFSCRRNGHKEHSKRFKTTLIVLP